MHIFSGRNFSQVILENEICSLISYIIGTFLKNKKSKICEYVHQRGLPYALARLFYKQDTGDFKEAIR